MIRHFAKSFQVVNPLVPIGKRDHGGGSLQSLGESGDAPFLGPGEFEMGLIQSFQSGG